jgi:hypothetical protein
LKRHRDFDAAGDSDAEFADENACGMPVLVAEPTPLKRRRASVLLDSALGTISNTLPFSGFATKPAGSSAVAADAAVLQRVAELEKRLEQSEKENALLKRAVVAQSHQNKALEEALKARRGGRCCVVATDD